MPRIARSYVVIPSELSFADRQDLCERLYEIQREVFEGVDYDAFTKYVVDSKAERTWILVHLNDSEEVVGYFAWHIFERSLAGKALAVFRAEAGSLRAYRGSSANAPFGIKRALSYMLQNPRKPIYYLGSLVHPSSYSLFANLHREVWPRSGIDTPSSLLALMSALADEFGLTPVDPLDPLVRQVGWKTRDTDGEREYWQRCERPAARFFIERNPGYGEGHGLLTLAPVSLTLLLGTARQLTSQKLRRGLERGLTLLQQIPLLRRFLRPKPQQIQTMLKAVPLFANLNVASLVDLTSSAEVLMLPAGSLVLREGDISEHMYIIVRGAVYVLTNRKGEERIIDQLSRGELFGEVALLTGERRTSSVRTATSTALLRIDRDTLDRLMRAHVSMEESLWRLCAQRRFDQSVQEESRFQGLVRAERRTWFAEGEHDELHSQEVLALQTGEHLFVVDGTAEVSRSGSFMSTQAPSFITAGKATNVVARSTTRVVKLPPAGSGLRKKMI